MRTLVAHNAFGLPLALEVKFTGNSQLLELGNGLWNVTTDAMLHVFDLP